MVEHIPRSWTAKQCRDMAVYFRGKIATLRKRADYPQIAERVTRLRLVAEDLEEAAEERAERKEQSA